MHIISFDIGATKTAIAVMDFEGRFLERPAILEPTPQDYQEAIGQFRAVLSDLYDHYDIKCIAGGAPGLDGNSGQFVRNPSIFLCGGGIALQAV